MSCAEMWPEHEHNPEVIDYEKVVTYLQGQVSDALSKEQAEDDRGQLVLNGSFYQYEYGAGEHALTHDSVRLVMKRPHPHDKPGEFVEVFALLIQQGNEISKIKSAHHSEHFVLRDYSDFQPSSYWFLDKSGLSCLEMDEAELPKAVAPSNEYDKRRIVKKIFGSNIVAISEQG